MEYKAVYRCRLCGAVYHNGTTMDALNTTMHMAYLSANTPLSRLAVQAPEIDCHFCRGKYNDSKGVADFQGWER